MANRPIALLLAEGISIDQLTSRITIFNSLGFIYTQAIPALLPKLVVVVMYELGDSPDAFEERVRVLAPDGALVQASQTPVESPGRRAPLGDTAHHSIHMLWQLVFRTTGDHQIVVERRPLGGEGAWEPVTQRVFGVASAGHPLFPPGPPPSGR